MTTCARAMWGFDLTAFLIILPVPDDGLIVRSSDILLLLSMAASSARGRLCVESLLVDQSSLHVSPEVLGSCVVDADR
jgi:hypothetical protein